jgi:two-component system chemotaxis response regulator CheY
MASIEYSKLHILLIDDEAFMRSLIESILKDMDIGFISVTKNGIEALETLRRSIRKVDLIFCDLEMPEMNGFQFIETVRRGDRLIDPNMPIVVLTAHSDEETVYNVLELGIDGFLVKPVSRDALEKRITAALKQ